MYTPKHFAETDVAGMQALMRAHRLATLVSHGPDGLNANHIPWLLANDGTPYGTLQGHVARANPLWKTGNVVGEVLVVFQGGEQGLDDFLGIRTFMHGGPSSVRAG